MAYGLYLVLDQPEWFANDFSSENKLTGTIYTDKQLQTAKNLTGYTIKILFYTENQRVSRFSETADIVVAGNGTWSLAVTENNVPWPTIYKVKAELTKSGARESTLNDVEIFIIEGPAA